MKTKILTLIVFTGALTLMISSCSFFRGSGSVTTDNQSICTNYSNENISTLPVPLVHDMINGYRNNQLLKIENGITKNGVNLVDAQSIWFDLETLKEFVYHIENETIKNDKTKSDKDLGIRIYYATYPEKDNFGWAKKEYDNILNNFGNNSETSKYDKLHTLVMIPTRKEGKLNIDFNPLDINTYNQSLKSKELSNYWRNPLIPITNNQNKYILSIGGPITTKTSAQNHGSLIPPRDPGLGEEGF